MTAPPAADAATLAGGFVGRLWRRLRPPPIATAESLASFLEERAALIAQKCAIEDCRGKTGLASYALFTEEPFLKALDVCRWETFVAALGDLVIVTEGHLRPHVAAERRASLRAALASLYSTVLSRLPAPVHRAHGWGDAIASFPTRLADAGRSEPRLARDIADHSAKRLFETLPIHASMRALDEEVVYGAVRFRMIAVSQELQRRAIVSALVGQLLADSTPGRG
jgi:hypothetical protein